jgi:hypothetical protein
VGGGECGDVGDTTEICLHVSQFVLCDGSSRQRARQCHIESEVTCDLLSSVCAKEAEQGLWMGQARCAAQRCCTTTVKEGNEYSSVTHSCVPQYALQGNRRKPRKHARVRIAARWMNVAANELRNHTRIANVHHRSCSRQNSKCLVVCHKHSLKKPPHLWQSKQRWV